MTVAPRPHRALVAVLLSLAFLIGFVSMFALWVNRQTLNPENGSEVSSKLLENEQIREAVGAYMVDQLFTQVDVSAQIETRLPEQFKAFATPAAAGLRELANDRAPEFLGRPRIQNAWEKANLAARSLLVRVVTSDNGDAVVLNLNNLITQLASDLGLNVSVPANVGRLELVKSNELGLARDVTKAVKGLALWGIIATFALFAVVVYLARGWRRIALRRAGWCLIALGLVIILARRVIGNRLIDDLVSTESVQTAGREAWLIITQMLYDIAIAAFAYGLVIVIAAWLAGDTKAAVATRRALAPEFRYRPGAVFAGAAFLYLLVLLWGPTPATRQAWGIVTIGAVLALGLEVLRRQVAREFPDAQQGENAERIRKRIASLRHASPPTNGDVREPPVSESTASSSAP